MRVFFSFTIILVTNICPYHGKALNEKKTEEEAKEREKKRRG